MGCDVTWLESVTSGRSEHEVRSRIDALRRDLAPFGFSNRIAVIRDPEAHLDGRALGCLGIDDVCDSELLVNFRYALGRDVVGRFPRTVLIDIDPGLLQLWIHARQLDVAPHDVYFTIGETVGQPGAGIPDVGIDWTYVPPCVALDQWPASPPPLAASRFTTIANWWAGAWLDTDPTKEDKRAGFLPFLDLPRHTSQQLELALNMGDADWVYMEEEALRSKGWYLTEATRVAATPSDYRGYIQGSLGEFSCAKPACIRLQNAWVSDRTLCYMASGRPAVVQHTGPSRILPDAAGMFRFKHIQEAAAALENVGRDYETHARLARRLVEEHFDARVSARRVLEKALP